jgi:acetolactate synthase-1/2/3 large subunit
MNLAELQTIVHHKLPIKIFIYNNDGYVSIRLTQNTFFNRRYVAANAASGVSCPDFIKIAKAYGIKTERILNNSQLSSKIKSTLAYKGPILCEVMVSPDQEFHPKAASKQLPDGSFVSQPLENMYPFLSREELKENMLIPLLDEE